MSRWGRPVAAAIVAFWAIGSTAGLAAHGAQPGNAVLATRVVGPITPVIADHLAAGVQTAQSEGYQAFLVELDTPGGLDTSMRKIIQTFLSSRVPIIVYVSPPGGRAASAGALITLSAHVAAMAPSTTIGAATPVDLQGGEISDKVINDAAAFARSVASERGRNVDFAEQTVRSGRAVTAEEALRLNAIELISPDRAGLLAALDGRDVSLAGGARVVLRTRDAAVVEQELGPFRWLLQLLADPNLALLFLSLGTLAVIYELANPGHMVSGIVGVILLTLGFVGLSVLPINIAGIALLLLGIALFIVELYTPGTAVFAVVGGICVLIGGLMLFQGPFRVSLGLLLPMVGVVALGSVLAGRLVWKARGRPPITGRGLLIGREAVVRRVDGEVGRVMLEGAWWNARTRAHELRPGQAVRVVDLQGLDLIVEPVFVEPVEEAAHE